MKISHLLFITESEQKLKSLGQQYPEAADAAAKLIRAYISNPKRPMNQLINKVVEETGVNRGTLNKIVTELGFEAVDA